MRRGTPVFADISAAKKSRVSLREVEGGRGRERERE
jgi:hypothetical protein